MQPLISVIVPVYNTEKHLKVCIDSIVNQTLTNIEIILINDGSSDDSLKILQEYAEQDSRIIVIDQENKGLGETRNVGIKLASAPYLSFIDSDDFISHRMLEILYKAALKDNADIVKCGFTRTEPDGKFTNERSNYLSTSKDDFFQQLISCNYLSVVWNALYTKNLFISNNLFFKKITYEDAEISHKLIHYAKKTTLIDKYFYFWRKTDGSITRSINFTQIDDIFKVLDSTYKFLEEHSLYLKYKNEFLQRCLYFCLGIVDKILNYERSTENNYLEYLNIKINKINFLSEESLKTINKKIYSNYIIKKSSLYLSANQNSFKVFSEFFCKDIYELSNKDDNYILYGNGTVAKVFQNIIPNKILGYVDMSDASHHPATLKDINFDKIIITVLGREHTIIEYLVEELGINKDKILTIQEVISYDSKLFEEAKKFEF